MRDLSSLARRGLLGVVKALGARSAISRRRDGEEPARWLRAAAALSALALALSACCARTRHDCEACLDGSPPTCAKGTHENGYVAQARCDAAEELCAKMDPATRKRECGPHSVSWQTGCDEAFLKRIRTTCSERTKWDVPLVGVK